MMARTDVCASGRVTHRRRALLIPPVGLEFCAEASLRFPYFARMGVTWATCNSGANDVGDCRDHGAPPVVPPALAAFWREDERELIWGIDGGYPCGYYTAGGDALCHRCASRALRELEPGERERPTMGGVIWETEELEPCDGCGLYLDVAYPTDEQQRDLDAQAP